MAIACRNYQRPVPLSVPHPQGDASLPRAEDESCAC